MEKDERRNERRVDRKLLVNISKDDGLESMGLTANISREGMFIATPDVLPIHCEVSILLGIADDTLSLKGQIIWSRVGTAAPSSDVQAAVGVRIIDAPEEYFRYVDNQFSDN